MGCKTQGEREQFERGYREGYWAAMEQLRAWTNKILAHEKPPMIQLCRDCPHKDSLSVASKETD